MIKATRRTKHTSKSSNKSTNFFKSLKRFFYNKDDKTILCKKPKYWGIIIAYEFAFGIVAVIFFFIVINFLDTFQTPYKLANNHQYTFSKFPVITIFPASEAREGARLIWLSPKNKNQIYVESIRNLLKEQNSKCLVYGSQCPFNESDLGPCAVDDYGYKNKTPCIYVKLNYRAAWTPSDYKKIVKKPRMLPERMKNIIKAERETVWVDCAGKTGYDNDKLGKIIYYPEQAYPDSNFPFRVGEHVQPLIALLLPDIERGFIIEIRCKMFFDEIEVEDIYAKAHLFVDWRNK